MALAWLDFKWDHPSSDQFYMMQIAAEVRKVLHKNPEDVDINKFQLPFDRGKKKETVAGPMTKEQATAIAMKKWFAIARYEGPN